MSQPTPDLNMAYQPMIPSQYMTQNQMPPAARRAKRRRTTNASLPYPTPVSDALANGGPETQTSHDNYVQQLPQQQQLQFQQQQQPQQQPNFDTAAIRDDQQPRNHELLQAQTFTQSALSPSFNFSPMPQAMNIAQPPPNDHVNGNGGIAQYDAFWGQGFDMHTPGGLSQSAESAHTDPMDKDPFLSLLEQLAQNDGNAEGGPSDLDFFLNGQGTEQTFGG